MCFRHNWFNEITGLMSEQTLDRIYDTFKIESIETIFFGGMGEPLIHPEIAEMINNARNAGKKNRDYHKCNIT